MTLEEVEHEIGASDWRLKKERYGLVGGSCTHCGEKTFPIRDICPNCGGDDLTDFQFSGKGNVLTYTRTTKHPDFEDFGEITLAIIKLEEGASIVAQIADPTENLQIGSEVKMVTRILKKGGERGIIKYGYKFEEVVTS